MYDPIQGRMLSADNFVGKPYGTQGYNRYSYANNNPLVYADPDGNFVILAVLIQAAVSAGTSAAVYSLSAGNKWNWSGFLKATALGALSGAIGGAVGELGQDILKLGPNSLGLGIASDIVGQIGTNIVTGNDITAGMLVGSIVGGLVNDRFGSWTGVKEGTAVENILGEFAFNATKFGVSGAASGFIGALVDGGNSSKGALEGLKSGALGGVATTGLNILAFGRSYVPDQEFDDYGHDNPVFRTGFSVARAFLKPGEGVTLGRNLITELMESKFVEKNNAVQAHEFGHYVDLMRLGMGAFYKRWLKEGSRYKFWGPLGRSNVYRIDATLEGRAQLYSLYKLGYYVDPQYFSLETQWLW